MTILSEESDKYSTNGKSHTEFIAQCDGGDGEYLRITWDDDPEWRYLWIEVSNDKRWRTRLKVAWKVLRGKHPENAAIILNEIAVRNLKKFLWGKDTIEPGLDVYISEVKRLETELEQMAGAQRTSARILDKAIKRASAAEQALAKTTMDEPCPHNDCILTHDSLVYCNECHRTIEPAVSR